MLKLSILYIFWWVQLEQKYNDGEAGGEDSQRRHGTVWKNAQKWVSFRNIFLSESLVFQVFRNVPANQIHVFYVRNVKITIETLKSRSETLEISVLLQKRCFRKLTHFWAFFHTVHGQHSFLGKGSMIRN